MSTREREDLLAQPGGPPCIAYELRPDGGMVTPSRWSRLPFYRAGLSAAAALAAAFPMLFSSCAPNRRTTMGAPMPLPASSGNSRLLGEIDPKSAAADPGGGQSAESRPLVKGRPAPPVMLLGTPPADF
ncbi:MAG: hypothetical protein V4726_21935 [Verrucomicrobiota bacterium]